MTSPVRAAMEPTVDTSGIPYIDGRIPFKGYSTWYRVYGEAESSGRRRCSVCTGAPAAATTVSSRSRLWWRRDAA
jgi:hypothetical protein